MSKCGTDKTVGTGLRKTEIYMKKFYLSSTDKKIGGVCGGIAEYFSIDSLLVRIITFALIWCGTVGLWVYLLIWGIAPRDNKI